MLDEIELFYHPDYQRKFINDLVLGIKNTKLQNVASINVLFSTHSPFILSDIPSQNILKLDIGKHRYDKLEKTFGANIHDLLANDFFLENGFMGEFAKSKINEVIDSMKILCILKDELQLDTDSKKLDFLKEQNGFEDLAALNLLTKYECENIIQIIGEPMLYMSLMELYKQTFGESSVDFIDEQIRRLENLKKQP